MYSGWVLRKEAIKNARTFLSFVRSTIFPTRMISDILEVEKQKDGRNSERDGTHVRFEREENGNEKHRQRARS